ncbi:MAG: hypothetical protein K2Y23_11165 [Cyanobacteria bacterium]|nr:hypothetical protein [Cyanobacteriota bacterium]
MRRSPFLLALCVGLVGVTSGLSADVRSDQRVKFQLGGMLGKMVNMFSKGAREGVVSTVAVKGNRKATMNGDTSGQIIDLSEEKIYDLDLKKKTYKVTTFAELRRQMQEAQREAEKNAKEMQRETAGGGGAETPAQKDPNEKELDVDFDIKNTGETRTINGFNTTKGVMTITVREKGKTLNDAGGLVMTTDMWMTPGAPSTKDLADFDRKYAEKVYGLTVTGASAQDMAMAMAMYPQMKPALDRMAKEGSKMPPGTAILTEMRMESVPPGTANQAADALPAPEEPKKKGLGGMLGGLKKMAEQAEKNQNSNAKPQRTIVMSTSIEMLKLTTDVDAASVAIPTGFKEVKN